MKKPPCIRGLKRFEKKGCPQKIWDGEEGCPAWIELTVSQKGNPLQKEIKRQCLDLWMFDFSWASMGQMEGMQQATESNRNMTALQSLVITGANSPQELINVATKHLEKSHTQLIAEAKGTKNDITI